MYEPLVFWTYVIFQTHGQDKYGRTLADLLLPDGTNINHELVKDGWCWWYRKYAPGNVELGLGDGRDTTCPATDETKLNVDRVMNPSLYGFKRECLIET